MQKPIPSPHIAPVGIGPQYMHMNKLNKMANLPINPVVHFVPGPMPIPALASPYTTGLGLPSTNSYGYWFQSSPAPSRTCPAPASVILVQYWG